MLWAQRKDRLLLKVEVADCPAPQIAVENDAEGHFATFSFRGRSGIDGREFATTLELFGELNKQESKVQPAEPPSPAASRASPAPPFGSSRARRRRRLTPRRAALPRPRR